ncbi:DUF7537 family lipoprotein [Halarchaeum sp. P4]|uniref:DUF7537 family lipoprotein n=1 Tax=Halarchaeum sp. P4 TaxID=3421639 RepID=UPI003EB90B1D
MRKTETLVTLGIVALVALAGCNGAMTGGSDEKPYETPLNGSEMDAQHAAALQEAGSFTYLLSLNTTMGDSTSSQNLAAKVDSDSGAYSLTTSTGLGTVSLYTSPNGTSYTRVNSSNGVFYRQGSMFTYNVSTFTRVGLTNMTERANFTYEGTNTLGGDTVHTYVSHVNASANASASGFLGNVSADASANATVRIDVRSDGVVKRVQYDVRTPDGTAQVTMRYTNIGSTDPTPSWLEAAKSNTTAQNGTN